VEGLEHQVKAFKALTPPWELMPESEYYAVSFNLVIIDWYHYSKTSWAIES
jgi:hypothetical protein